MNAGSGSTVRRLLTVGFAASAALDAARSLPQSTIVQTNDNTKPAARLRRDTLHLWLVVRMAASMRSPLADASANPGEQK